MKNFVLGLLVFFAGYANANCGLQSCPVNLGMGMNAAANRGILSFQVMGGDYDQPGLSSDYWVLRLRSQYMVKDWLRVAAALPYAFAEVNGADFNGVSDAMLEAMVRVWKSLNHRVMLWVGSQMEIPLGDEDDFLGSGHFEALPYADLHLILGDVVSFFQFGARLSLGHEHGTSTGAVSTVDGSIFDPHFSKELVYRAGFLAPLLPRLSTLWTFSGQTGISDGETGTSFFSLRPQFNILLTERFELQTSVELPLNNNQRFDWRVQTGLNYLF